MFIPGDIVLLPSGAIGQVTGRDADYVAVVYLERGHGGMMIHEKYLELVSHGPDQTDRKEKAVR